MVSSFFSSKGGANAEHALFAVEAAVRCEDMAVGIEYQKIAEGLYGDNGTGDRIVLQDSLLEEDLRGFPS